MENAAAVCFGEVLWDLLPHGRFLGGAPLNVAYHLARLGRRVRMVSAVGDDPLGAETRAAVAAAGVATDGLAVRPGRPTGTVAVTLREGQPSYRIAEGVAWDELPGPAAGAAAPSALVHGTLALRTPANRAALSAWIEAGTGLRVCDLNLRAPFDDLAVLAPFARGAGVLKLNAEEAARVAAFLGVAVAGGPAAQAPAIARAWGCAAVCVTLGAEGALVWDGRELHRAAAPAVTVRDAIGAGDAFTAALLDTLLGGPPARPDWPRALARACALGAFVAARDGAQPAYAPGDVPGLR